MKSLTFEGKTYYVDDDGFLSDHNQWDEAFADGMAPSLEISRLSKKHWEVVYFIRDAFRRNGKCPLVYETCRSNKLRIRDLQELFPTGYLRGACKLAGITYKEGYHASVSLPAIDRAATLAASGKESASAHGDRPHPEEKTYGVDVRGFLADPGDWDEQYAVYKAYEMGIEEPLAEEHWKIIYFLRENFRKSGVVPTIYETCKANHLEIEHLERLFPQGYHRGAVKIAGLRVR